MDSTVLPSGVMQPIPVTTTRRFMMFSRHCAAGASDVFGDQA
jgi:hypothetical protein